MGVPRSNFSLSEEIREVKRVIAELRAKFFAHRGQPEAYGSARSLKPKEHAQSERTRSRA